MMAQAGVKSRIRFGYLHIISDNVAEKYEEDLSNERMQSVLSRRSKLYDVVQRCVGELSSHSPFTGKTRLSWNSLPSRTNGHSKGP